MKFNKDTFLNDITDKVQSAIDKNLITKEDVDTNNIERLHGFIQYALAELIEDRKFALDVLKDFNYDEKTPWENLQEEYGVFGSLMDIALVNLWKFLQSEGCTKYEYYKYDNRQKGSMLDIIHDDKETQNGSEFNNADDDKDNDYNLSNFKVPDEESEEKPRKKLRIVR